MLPNSVVHNLFNQHVVIINERFLPLSFARTFLPRELVERYIGASFQVNRKGTSYTCRRSVVSCQVSSENIHHPLCFLTRTELPLPDPATTQMNPLQIKCVCHLIHHYTMHVWTIFSFTLGSGPHADMSSSLSKWISAVLLRIPGASNHKLSFSTNF